ncbi:MAG: hypothetical protein HN368_03295 [Spirochaetales bacterium]|jgi:N-acetylneuraminate lyase|nr:hypothetical protein [Spirochaetales bacterium]
MKNQKITGVISALVTPFDGNDKVNETVVKELVAYLLSKKAEGFYLCGTTGQGLWMNSSERKRVAETTIDAVNGAVPVIVHVGCVAPGEAAGLAAHAAANGASAISSIIPPTYTTLSSIVSYFNMLSVAAPDMQLFPYFMGATLPPMEIMEGLKDVPTLAGTKYTGPNMYEMTSILAMGNEPWSVFSGMDEQCIFAAMCGTDGAIGSSVNIMTGLYKEIRRLVATDNQGTAYKLQQKANRVITILKYYNYPAALRAALGFLGFECGDPRLPAVAFDKSKLENMKSELMEAGFEEITSM